MRRQSRSPLTLCRTDFKSVLQPRSCRADWACLIVPHCYRDALSRETEMALRASCIALLLASLPIAGCGTVANLVKSQPEQGGTTSFGGVRQDLSCLKKAENGEFSFGKHPKAKSDQDPQIALMLLIAADLPLSLIGDVVTWPYTATYTYINQPTPVPPVTLAPVYPVTQATVQDRPPTSPSPTPQGGGR